MIIEDNKLFYKFASSQGKLIGIDIGTKRIGIATCDATRTITTPKKIINRNSNSKDFLEIKNIFIQESAVAIVAGMPINMNGTENEMSRFSKKFLQELDIFLENKVFIFLSDERLTSFEAKQTGISINSRKNDRHFDDIAAAIILKDFIETVKCD